MNDQDKNGEFENETNDQRKSRKKKSHAGLYVILVILVLLLAAFLWFVFFNHSEPQSSTSQNSSSTTVTDENTAAENNTTDITTDNSATDDAAATNDSGEINTVGTETDINGLKQTLTDAQISQTLGTTTAPEGQTYLKVDWTINNTTDGELGFNPNNYVAYANGNQVQPVKVDDPTITPLTAQTIQPGGSVNGSIIYQIPTTWSVVQIYSHINPTINQEVEYRITSDQL